VLSITTVGTGTAFPEAERGPTCMLVRNEDRNIVIDVGSGSLEKLCQQGVTPLSMDALLLTHAHLDHFADLIPLLFALHVPGYGRTTPLPVYASRPTFDLLDRLRTSYQGWIDVPEPNVEFVVLEAGETLEVCGLEVSVHPVQHTESSIGYRLTGPDGEVLAVPGDSGPCDGLTALCTGADLAIVECSMPDVMPIEGHMHPTALRDLVEASGLRRLAVTHRYPAAVANDAVGTLRSLVSIDVVVPDDGDTLLVRGT
jgi:ribonuclease BN (tRNA processing enzyme)